MSNRTLFACTWCGAEQQLLDLGPRDVADATQAWHAEHDHCNPNHGHPRTCSQCDTTSPVQPVDVRGVIGLQTFDAQAHADWLDTHDCTTSARATWDKLTNRTHIVGTVADLVGPRPSWAPARLDQFVDTETSLSAYRSESVVVPTVLHPAAVSDHRLHLARAEVRARRTLTGPQVSVTHRQHTGTAWEHRTIVVTTAEARQLAGALHAAADLAADD